MVTYLLIYVTLTCGLGPDGAPERMTRNGATSPLGYTLPFQARLSRVRNGTDAVSRSGFRPMCPRKRNSDGLALDGDC